MYIFRKKGKTYTESLGRIKNILSNFYILWLHALIIEFTAIKKRFSLILKQLAKELRVAEINGNVLLRAYTFHANFIKSDRISLCKFEFIMQRESSNYFSLCYIGTITTLLCNTYTYTLEGFLLLPEM